MGLSNKSDSPDVVLMASHTLFRSLPLSYRVIYGRAQSCYQVYNEKYINWRADWMRIQPSNFRPFNLLPPNCLNFCIGPSWSLYSKNIWQFFFLWLVLHLNGQLPVAPFLLTLLGTNQRKKLSAMLFEWTEDPMQTFRQLVAKKKMA